MKTAHGFVPIDGVFPIEPEHLDTVGPMGKDIAHTVQGMDLLQDGFAALYAAAVAARPAAQEIRIGRPTLTGTDPKIDQAVDEALASTGTGAESAEELIQKGDVPYAKLQAAEALKFYLPAEKLDPNNVRLLVRIARQYRHLMSDATQAREKLQLGHTAVDYALRAVALAPNDPETQLALAISYGKMLPFEGTKQQIANSRLIKIAVDKVIALDPTNDLAWHLLGRWYRALADVGTVKRAYAQVAYGKLPPAKCEDAVRCFEKAIALNPNRLMHYIELGRTYAQMGRDAEARKFITKGLAMPETEKDDPETKNLGRQVLKKLP